VTALEALHERTIKNRRVVIKPIAPADDADGCQILAIGESARRNLPVALDQLLKKSVLTISDLPRFAENGGGIGFVNQNGKVRFEISMETAKNSHLKISSQLLKLAIIVKD
jgi:hypothetical protein